MAESKPKKSSSSKPKVFDVAHPSKNVASPTSRPVIVGHTNTIKKDPMVAPVEQSENEETPQQIEEPANEPIAKVKRELVIQPVDEETPAEPAEPTEATETADDDSPDVNSDEPDEVTVESSITEDTAEVSETDETENAEEEQAEESEAETAQETASRNDDAPLSEDNSGNEAASATGAVDALVAGVNTKKERKDQEEKEAKRQEEIQALIASKKYNVKTHIPPGKRNIIWLIVLVIIAVLAAAGWYVAVGPARSLWDKKPASDTSAVQTQPSSNNAQITKPSSSTEQPAAKTTEFNNPKYGISFTYPSDWKVATAKDQEFDTRDIITLTSPTETIKTSADAKSQVDAEVFLRTKIIVENTKLASDYASDLVDLAACDSEDIIAQTTTLKLLYVDGVNKAPSVSQVSVSPSNCVAAGTKFTGNDQVQFTKKANTYIIYTEYVYSDAYLKKIGTTDADAVKLAQETGVAVTKDSFKSGKSFVAFTGLVKSLKEI